MLNHPSQTPTTTESIPLRIIDELMLNELVKEQKKPIKVWKRMKTRELFLEKFWDLKKNRISEKLLLISLLLMLACSSKSSNSVSRSNMHNNSGNNQTTLPEETLPSESKLLSDMFGLKNFGNTCYINATITLLWKAYASVPGTMDQLRNYQPTSDSKDDLKKQFADLFKTMRETYFIKNKSLHKKNNKKWIISKANKKNKSLIKIVNKIKNTDIDGSNLFDTENAQEHPDRALFKILEYPNIKEGEKVGLDFFDTFGYFSAAKKNGDSYKYLDRNGFEQDNNNNIPRSIIISPEEIEETASINKVVENYLKKNYLLIPNKKAMTPKVIFVVIPKPGNTIDAINEQIEIVFNYAENEKINNDKMRATYKLQGVAYHQKDASKGEDVYQNLSNELEKMDEELELNEEAKETFKALVKYLQEDNKEDETAKNNLIEKLQEIINFIQKNISEKNHINDNLLKLSTEINRLKKLISTDPPQQELYFPNDDVNALKKLNECINQLTIQRLDPTGTQSTSHGHWNTYLKTNDPNVWTHHNDTSVSLHSETGDGNDPLRNTTNTQNPLKTIQEHGALFLYVLKPTRICINSKIRLKTEKHKETATKRYKKKIKTFLIHHK